MIALALTAASPALASDLRANAQVWEEIDISGDLGAGWDVTGLLVSREGADIPNPALWGGGAIFDRRAGALTLSAGDLAVVARSATSGARLHVNVPLAAVAVDWRLGGFHFSDRNRAEDLIGVPGNPWRYRNRLAVEHAVSGAGPIVAVFANEELFYDLAKQQWTRSRAQAGVTLALAHAARFRLYYLRQDDRVSLPRAVNALGLTLVIALARSSD